MKKVGILTLYKSYNYGALLQAYATYQFLINNGYETYFINYQNNYEGKYNKLLSYRKNLSLKENLIIFVKNTIFKSYFYCKKSFEKFIANLPQTELINNDFSNIDNFDVIIAGSDQIWNPKIFGNILDQNFLLDFDTSAKKISYSSSLGSYTISKELKDTYQKCLNNFYAISVREDFAKFQLQELVKKDIKVVCDPTILLDKDTWLSNITKGIEIKEKYVLVYLMSKYEDYEDIIIKFAKEHNLKIAFISFSDIKRNGVDYHLKGLTPFEFLSTINNAEYVLTNSFHGTVFSLIFNKKFYSLYFNKNPKRVENLLNKFGLKSRIIKKYCDIIDETIDYKEVNEKLNEIRQDSAKWFVENIEKGKVIDNDKKSD